MTMHGRIPHGFWLFVWVLDHCGGVAGVISKCHQLGIDGIFLKGADGDSTWGQCSAANVAAFHAAGLGVIGWQYVYGGPGGSFPIPAWSSVQGEIAAANWILDQGVDGYCFDDEVEMDAKPAVAIAQVQGILAKHPNASIGYNPYPYPSSDPSHPFFEYNSYGCDYCMPQLYQRQDNLGTPAQALARMEADFALWSPIWAARAGGKPALPLLIDWQYASWGARPSPTSDILDAARISRAHNYPLITGWDWDALTASEWVAVAQAVKFFKGAPSMPVDTTGLGSGFADYATANNLQGLHTPEVHETGWSWAAWDTVVLTYDVAEGVKAFPTDAGWAVRHIQAARETEEAALRAQLAARPAVDVAGVKSALTAAQGALNLVDTDVANALTALGG